MVAVASPALARRGRIGGWAAAVGLAGMVVGVIVEFWIFGGLAGDRDGAILGWLIYLVAGVHIAWLPSGMLGDAWLVADQVLIGLAWVAIGIVSVRR
jgi:hypothetical protein